MSLKIGRRCGGGRQRTSQTTHTNTAGIWTSDDNVLKHLQPNVMGLNNVEAGRKARDKRDDLDRYGIFSQTGYLSQGEPYRNINAGSTYLEACVCVCGRPLAESRSA